MATTKKASTGTAAGAGARKGVTKANGVAQKSPSASTSKPTVHVPAAKKAAPPKLSDRQREFLGKIKAAGDSGYEVSKKVEQRTLDALMGRKLVKRGARNKETGNPRFLLTKAGATQLPVVPAATAPAPPASVAAEPTLPAPPPADQPVA